MLLGRITMYLAAAAALASVVAVFVVGDMSSIFLFILGLIFAVWSAAPFVFVYFVARSLQSSALSTAIMLIGLIIMVASSVYIFWTVFFFNENPDAQDGIVLVFLPIYQAMVAGVFFGVSYGIFSWRKK